MNEALDKLLAEMTKGLRVKFKIAKANGVRYIAIDPKLEQVEDVTDVCISLFETVCSAEEETIKKKGL